MTHIVRRRRDCDVEAQAGDFQSLVVDGERGARGLQALLGEPGLDIVGCDLADDRDLDGGEVEYRAVGIRFGRLDAAPDPTEQVDLPGGISAERKTAAVTAVAIEILPRSGRCADARHRAGTGLDHALARLTQSRRDRKSTRLNSSH